MSNHNVFGTNDFNNQNMLIDMDNSRIIVTNSTHVLILLFFLNLKINKYKIGKTNSAVAKILIS